MVQAYSDPSRTHETYTLPDIEVFHAGAGELWASAYNAAYSVYSEAGFYYWYCFPGCMPDSDPYGPYPTAQAAIDAAQADAGE